MSMRRLLAIAALAVAACDSPHPRVCLPRAAELLDWVDATAHEHHPLSFVALADTADAPPPPDKIGTLVVIKPRSIEVDGYRADTQADADRELSMTLRPTSLAIDRDTPIDRVAMVASALAASGRTDAVLVLVTHPAHEPPPPPSPLTAALESAISPRARFARAERALRHVAADCPPLAWAWRRDMTRGVDNVPGALEYDLELALCGCRIDTAVFRTAWWYSYGPGYGSLGAFAVTFAPRDDAAATLITGTTWADAAPALIAAAAKGQRVRVVARAK